MIGKINIRFKNDEIENVFFFSIDKFCHEFYVFQ